MPVHRRPPLQAAPIEPAERRPQSPLEQLPPIAARNARETGTDLARYLTESFRVFVLHDGDVYHAYSTAERGVEFLMGYDGILDRAPKGRDEGDGFQLWIRSHDEYETE